jgi:hypothetical protein
MPGKPASIEVGTFGSVAGRRIDRKEAHLPALTESEYLIGNVSHEHVHIPAEKACCRWTQATIGDLKNFDPRQLLEQLFTWVLPPGPPCPKASLPGFALAYSIISFSDLNG